jgi:nitroreductase
MPAVNSAVLEFMQSRRSASAKQMAGPGPSADEVAAMAAIASRVPDHGKLAPWHFIHYGKRACERIDALRLQRAVERDPQLSQTFRDFEAHRFSSIPAVVAVVSRAKQHVKIPLWEQELSAGAAAFAFLIAANAHGFDAQWITEAPAYDEAMHSALGLKDGERIAGFICIGTSTVPKTERDRPQLADIFSVLDD